MHSPFITKGWQDYQLIDSGLGERLERVAGFYVVRPDTTALWKPKNPTHEGWQRPAAKFTTESGWVTAQGFPQELPITWNNLKLTSKLTAFKHLGFFPEQASQWSWLEEIIAKRTSQGAPVKVLNLFAYTGVATSVAARAGASVCHVDSAKGSVHWASENARRNELEEKPVRWIVDDVRKFVQREVKRGSKYDIILLDPPAFGRGAKGEIWRLADDLPELLENVAELYSAQPIAFLMNFYATELYPHAITRLCNDALGEKFGGAVVSQSVGLLQSEGEEIVQTGEAAYWHREG